MKDGKGIEKCFDGSFYEGEFKKNLRHGNGILKIGKENLPKYIGEFKEDNICGHGKYIWNESKEYIGEWKNNQICGYGMLIDGKICHLGYFEKDKKEGYGACFYNEINIVLIGRWEDDLTEGPAIIIDLNYNFDIDNEKIVGMCKGEILYTKLDGENLSKFKNSDDYVRMKKLFKEKIFPDYQKYNNN